MNCCGVCGEFNIGPDHDITEKHIKNRILCDYALNRNQFCGNRNGILISCSVKSLFTEIKDCTDDKINISVKPNEDIKYIFSVKNDRQEKIAVTFIQMAHNKLNFVMNDHQFNMGCDPFILEPKQTIKRELSISFKSPNIGQYEMPVIFSFKKPATDESILIQRDVVAFVEVKQTGHIEMPSPYELQVVTAEQLFKTTKRKFHSDNFRIPKNYKTVYAAALKINDNASPEIQKICEDIKNTLENGVTEKNYEDFFHNLLWYEETIIRINLKNYNMSNVLLKKQQDWYELGVPGLAEKRPSLMLGDLIFVRPHKNNLVMFEATITDTAGDNIVKIKHVDPAFNQYYSPFATFDVRFFMSRLPLERMHQAVKSTVTNSTDLRRVFPKANRKLPEVTAITRYMNPVIEGNPEQARAVAHMVAGSAGLAPYLLHGPPGTGKTITIVEAILQLVRKSASNRIMVCTDSNMAADHVATMLIQYAHSFPDRFLLRASSKHRVWETLPECLQKYSNGKDRYSYYPVKIADFKNYSIVITTLSHAAKFANEIRSKKMSRSITHLFIDEAAQASEPACLIPCAGLLAPRGRLVLAGDPLQLGPVVISHDARRRGLGLSLMERLMKTCSLYNSERKDPNYTLMLRNNFRSNPDILQIPNTIFYEGQLRALSKEDPLSTKDILGEKPNSRAVVFHGVLSKEQKMGKSPSFFNNMELEIVQMYINFLINEHNVLPEDIGVVAPYIRQVYKIKTWLDNQGFTGGKIEVGTVEAFQGKEKRVIIISTVRANCNLLDHDAKFQLGFLVDDKRFNVALTRAKAKAIIIGNPLCLEKDVKWRTYIQLCREFGTYFGYDPQLDGAEGAGNDIVEKLTPLLKDIKINKEKKKGRNGKASTVSE